MLEKLLGSVLTALMLFVVFLAAIVKIATNYGRLTRRVSTTDPVVLVPA